MENLKEGMETLREHTLRKAPHQATSLELTVAGH